MVPARHLLRAHQVVARPQVRVVLPRVVALVQVHLRAHLVPAAVVARVVRQARHLLQVARQVVVHRAVLVLLRVQALQAQVVALHLVPQVAHPRQAPQAVVAQALRPLVLRLQAQARAVLRVRPRVLLRAQVVLPRVLQVVPRVAHPALALRRVLEGMLVRQMKIVV